MAEFNVFEKLVKGVGAGSRGAWVKYLPASARFLFDLLLFWVNVKYGTVASLLDKSTCRPLFNTVYCSMVMDTTLFKDVLKNVLVILLYNL